MTTDASAATGEKLFISYAGPDRPWAEWVAWQLEQAGYVVELDLWDWAAGDNSVVRINQALERADRMVALFSEAYFEHQRFTTEEWTAVTSRRDRQGRLVPLRIGDVTLPAVLNALIAPSLADRSAEDAHRVLINAVQGAQRPTAEPDFPGAQVPRPRSAAEAPRLPGGHQPTLWQVPRRNADFVGRDRDIDGVRRELRPGRPVVVQSGVPLGGVGKTQVAVEYVHRFAAQYDLVAWINAEEPQLVPAQLTALAADLGLVVEHGEAGALPALRRHLQQPKRWLMVFDNAETAEAVQPWVPADVGHVLITSRSRDWSEFARVNLELLTRRESVTLLRNRVPELSVVDADLVADRLGDLPLALVQAATVLSTMPAELYLQILDTDADEVLNEGLPRSYPRSLAAALRVSINELADHGEALDLLRLCCVLAPEPVPMTLLSAAPSAVPESLRPVVTNPMRLYRTATQLGDLVRVSQRGIQVHRLVQTLVLNQLDACARDELRHQAGSLLAASHPGEPASAATWPAWSQLMPHLLALNVGDTDDHGLRDAACDAMLYLLYSGNTDAGFGLAQHLYDRWRQRLGPDDRHTLTAASELAHAFHNQGRDREALDLTKDTLARRQRTLGPNDPATLRSASDYTVVLASLGKLNESIDRAEDLLTHRIAVLGADHPDTLTTRAQIAGCRGQTGNHRAASTGLDHVLTDRLRILGPDHPDTLSTRANLTRWTGEAGDHTTAITAFKELLTDQVRVLGPEHSDTLRTRANLARWTGEAGDHTSAITAYKQLLTDQVRIVGSDHYDTLRTRANLARWTGEAGDHTSAITGFKELLTDHLRILGPDHPDTLSTRANLAGWTGRAGDHTTAITAFKELLTDQVRILGPDHPGTLRTRGNIATWKGETGDHTSAITGFKELLTDQLRILGPDHPDTLTTRGNIAGWTGRAGDHTTAITTYEQLLTDRLRILGPDHPDTLSTRGNLAGTLLRRGAVLAARTQVTLKLEAERRLFGQDDHRTQRTRELLNEIKIRMGGRARPSNTKQKKR